MSKSGLDRRTLNERQFRRVKTFHGKDSALSEFAFVFKRGVRASSLHCLQILEWSEQQEDLTEEELELQYSSTDDYLEDVAGQLYDILCMCLEGEPNTIAQAVASMNGFVAWQRLSKKYNPNALANALRSLVEVISPPKAKTSAEVLTGIEKCELKRQVFECDFGEKVSERMKAAALIHMMPSDLQDILFQSADQLSDYKLVKDKMVALLNNRMASGGPVPMDVGSLQEQRPDYEELDVEAVSVDVQCRSCSGWGHYANECLSRRNGKAKGGGYDRGRGKGGGGKGTGALDWNKGGKGANDKD